MLSLSLPASDLAHSLAIQGRTISMNHVSSARQPLTSHEGGDDDEGAADAFSSVLAALQQSQIAPLAIAKRHEEKPTDDLDADLGDPLYGSYHILFPVSLSDGSEWLVKIPQNGSPGVWDRLSADALEAEANTMRVLKRETSVPVPAVIGFSSTTDNILGCPYIILSHVAGHSLYDIWFGRQLRDQDADLVHRHRVNALRDIASAMTELSSYPFEKGGSPIFDVAGKMAGVGPTRYLDQQSMLDRWFIHQDPSDDPIYVQLGPFSNAIDYYLCSLDLHTARKETPDGLTMVLRQLIQWLPEPESVKPFVLAHSDFDIQNFIVSEHGELRAIIDWDGICAVPRIVGNESLPGWLTRDWDPSMYGYKESMDHGQEPEGVWEDSPADLARYRRIYRDLLHACLGNVDVHDEVDCTSTSLIAENLLIAAREPAHCRPRPCVQAWYSR